MFSIQLNGQSFIYSFLFLLSHLWFFLERKRSYNAKFVPDKSLFTDGRW